jgi:hypothetical protein
MKKMISSNETTFNWALVHSQINVIIIIPFIMILIFFTASSCSKEEKEELSPEISFIQSSKYIYKDTSMEVNTDFMIGINASPNANSKTALTSLKIARTFSGQSSPWLVLTEPVTKEQFPKELSFTAISITQTETYSFTIIDEDGQDNTIELNITTFE